MTNGFKEFGNTKLNGGIFGWITGAREVLRWELDPNTDFNKKRVSTV
jgi:hypothetical protein